VVWCGVVWNRFVLLCDVMLCTGCKKYVNDVEDVKGVLYVMYVMYMMHVMSCHVKWMYM